MEPPLMQPYAPPPPAGPDDAVDFESIDSLDPSDQVVVERWLRLTHPVALARNYALLVDRKRRLAELLRRVNGDKRRVSARLVEVLRQKYPQGLLVDGSLYRAHADGQGVEAIPGPDSASAKEVAPWPGNS